MTFEISPLKEHSGWTINLKDLNVEIKASMIMEIAVENNIDVLGYGRSYNNNYVDWWATVSFQKKGAEDEINMRAGFFDTLYCRTKAHAELLAEKLEAEVLIDILSRNKANFRIDGYSKIITACEPIDITTLYGELRESFL